MTFDTAKWTAERGNYDGHSRRAGLVGALPAAGVKPGAPRASVRETLGEPDATDAKQDVYYLGRSDLAPDIETLVIDYGPDAVVTKVQRSQS